MDVLDLDNLRPEESKRLDQLAYEVKTEYNELVSQWAGQFNYDFDWLLSPLLSRNPYLVPTFEQLCSLRLVGEIHKKEGALGKVITTDVALAKVLKESNISVELRQNSSINHGFRAKAKRFLILLYTAFVYLKTRSRKRPYEVFKGKELVLIELFLMPSMFKEGRFEDRYFPGILDHLEEDQRSEIYFIPQLTNIKQGIKPMLKMSSEADYQFLYKFDYLKLRDYCFALLASWRMRKKTKCLKIGVYHGFNIQPLAEEAVNRSYFNNSQFIGLLNYRFIKRLKEKGIKVRLVVDWFENQPIDKGLHRAIHEYYPQAETKGYLGFIVSWLYNLYMQPLTFEKETKLLPNKVSVVGKSVVEDYMPNYNIDVETAPAFRFNIKSFATSVSVRSTVLFALPIHVEDSLALIRLADSMSKLPEFEEVQFLVKGHPACELNELISKAGILKNKNLGVAEGDFSKLLASAKVMVSTASTTCLEAVLSGVPVLIMANNRGLTQNPIPVKVPRELWSIVYNENEARERLNKVFTYSEATMSELAEFGNSKRKDYFEEVNKETVSKFLLLT